MPEIEIRPGTPSDIPALIKIEHNYSSDFVWQMDYRQEEGEIVVSFREVRLPRTAQVRYPKDYKDLENTWKPQDGLLVAEIDDDIVGYIHLNLNKALKTTWIVDLAVKRDQRRQGIGSALIIASQEWSKENGSNRLILEMQPKNYPTIQLARKLGFELCGYNDHYFTNHDIALFFSKWVR